MNETGRVRLSSAAGRKHATIFTRRSRRVCLYALPNLLTFLAFLSASPPFFPPADSPSACQSPALRMHSGDERTNSQRVGKLYYFMCVSYIISRS